VLFIASSTAFPLLVEHICVNFSAHVLTLVGFCLLDHLSEKTLLMCELCHGLAPGDLHLAVQLGRNDPG